MYVNMEAIKLFSVLDFSGILWEAYAEVAANVELIGPNLMFEYVTLAPGLEASTSAGTPLVTAQVPRGPPGPVLVVG
jgi:hypothetical protein